MSRREKRGQPLEALIARIGLPGRAVTVTVAENLSTVLACVSAICSGLSSLPVYLYRQDSNGRSQVTSHPVARLLRQPNRHQSWPNYLETTLASTLLFGNGVSVIEYDGRGAPTALRPVLWTQCVVSLMASGRLAYDLTLPTLFGPSDPPQRFFDDSILHFRDRSDDSLIGRSRISRAPGVISNAAGLQEFTANFWEDGLAPGAVLKHPRSVTQPARDRLKADFDAHRGGTKRKTILLEEGLDLSLLSVSPEAAEVLASRRFTVAELCRLFQVPPIVVGDFEHASLQNAQQAARWFCVFTLAPWAKKIEAEIARALLPEDGSLFVQFDMSELLRGDPEAQMASLISGVTNGVLTSNEARVAQGYPPHPDGGRLRTLPGELPAASGPAPAAPAPAGADPAGADATGPAP